ncbi:HipA family kinase [Ruegeria arenilitoris]|uniref:HipA family kinase n=1 Tax=Ruegeria arenilitoris TaxID=1173585 RepID=UPI00147C8034|nr:HipA family kinase [Ruegeria arenilitoris]
MTEIQFATVLPGAAPFNHLNINRTFDGQVVLEDQSVKHAIIKDIGLLEICNELVANELARRAGLPTPNCYLGEVPNDEIPVENGPRITHGGRLVFVSEKVKVPSVTFQWIGRRAPEIQALCQKIAKWEKLGSLYAFDAWLANVDRNQGNLLFGGDDDVWLIDHGKCFTGENWSPSSLDANQDYPSVLELWLTGQLTLEQKKKSAQEAREFGAALNGFDATETSKNSRVEELLPLEHLNALKEFLEKRVAVVAAQASKALGVPTLAV